MKKFLVMFLLILMCQNLSFAEEIIAENSDMANQEIEASNNKIIVVVQKQPLNEKSNQKVVLKKNWLGVYIQVNGKVKVNPITSRYEVE